MMIKSLAFISAALLVCGVSFGDGDPLANFLASKAANPGGICSIPRCGDGNLAVTMAKAGFLVHAMESADKLDEARKVAIDSGLIGRAVYLQKGSLAALPLADNSVDLLVITDATPADLTDAARKEIIRVLSPCIGRAIVGRSKSAGAGGPDKTALETWVKNPAVEKPAVVENELGTWATFGKPALEGADDWTHWFHGPDNNPVSADKAFTAPWQLGWLGRPYLAEGRLVGGRVVARGRIFEATEVTTSASKIPELKARSAYNGTIFWKRELPKSFRAVRSVVVAEGDLVFVAEDAAAVCLDTATGKEVTKIDFSQAGVFIKWLALSGGNLVALCGPAESPADAKLQVKQPGEKKPGPENGIAAYNLTSKKVTWTFKESAIDSRMIGICGDKVVFSSLWNRLGCLDINDGRLVWANDNPDLVGKLSENSPWIFDNDVGNGNRPRMLCAKDAVCITCANNFVSISPKDGSILWEAKRPEARAEFGMPLYRNGLVYVDGLRSQWGVGIVEAATGKDTKAPDKFKFGGGCGTTTFSENFICAQVGGIDYDFDGKKSFETQHLKTQCFLGTFITQGMYYSFPAACHCSVIRGYIGQAPMSQTIADAKPDPEKQLQPGQGDAKTVAPLKTDQKDWATHRGGNNRTGSTQVSVPEKPQKAWEFTPQFPYAVKKAPEEAEFAPTPPAAAGGLFFYGGSDGRITCLDGKDGKPKWTYFTQGAILTAPTVWEGRVFVGSTDGNVYALEAATGRLLWRFTAAPAERNIMVYGSLQNSWPVNTGVLIDDGTAYFAAGMTLQPKAFVYAIDAITGKVKWLNSELAHPPVGYMTVFKGKLWLRTFRGGSGGAVFDLKDGKMDPPAPTGGLRGRDIGVLKDRFIIYGGGDVYHDVDQLNGDRDTKFAFLELDQQGQRILPDSLLLGSQLVAPAWNDKVIIMCGHNFQVAPGKVDPQCWDVDKTMDFFSQLAKGTDIKKLPSWRLNQLPEEPKDPKLTMKLWGPLPMTINSAVLADNAAVITSFGKKLPNQTPKWKIGLYKLSDGSTIWEEPLASEPALDGLCIDRDGNIFTTLRSGGAICFGK